MNIILLILLLFIPCIGFGQSKEKIKYWGNGQLQSESIIKDDVEELMFYDRKGNLTNMGDGC